MPRVLTWIVALGFIVVSCGPAGQEPERPGADPTVAASLASEPLGESEGPQADAVVDAEGLNVRSGPGRIYSIMDTIVAGTQLSVTGQAYGCDWLQVVTPMGTEGWVSRPFVTLNLPCSEIGLASIPPTPTPGAPSAVSGRGDPAGTEFLLVQPLFASLGGRQHFIWRDPVGLSQARHMSCSFGAKAKLSLSKDSALSLIHI